MSKSRKSKTLANNFLFIFFTFFLNPVANMAANQYAIRNVHKIENKKFMER